MSNAVTLYTLGAGVHISGSYAVVASSDVTMLNLLAVCERFYVARSLREESCLCIAEGVVIRGRDDRECLERFEQIPPAAPSSVCAYLP